MVHTVCQLDRFENILDKVLDIPVKDILGKFRWEHTLMWGPGLHQKEKAS